MLYSLLLALLSSDAAEWNRLAVERYQQGALAEAENLYHSALAAHPQPLDVAKIWSNLGALHKRQARWQEAEDSYKRALEIRVRHVGEGHADTAVARNNLAEVYRMQGRYLEARPLYESALRALAPAANLDTAQVMNNLAEWHRLVGQTERAEALLRESLAIKLRLEVEVCAARNNLGRVRQAAGDSVEAERLFHQALDECPQFGFAMLNLGRLHREQGNLAESERWHQRALDSSAAGDRLFLAAVEHEIANTYASMGRLTDAEWRYARTVDLHAQMLPSGHPERISALLDYAKLKRMRKDKRSAARLEGEARKMLAVQEAGNYKNATVSIQALRSQ